MQKERTPLAYPTMLLDKDWSDSRYFTFPFMGKDMAALHNLEVRADDVFVVTLPKCGTTWMQELAWLVTNDFDFEQAKRIDLDDRSPSFEMTELHATVGENNIYRKIDELPSPRIIKGHYGLPFLPKQLWEKKAKIIYVFRDPRDAMVSMYHYQKGLGAIPKDQTLEENVRACLQFEIENNATWTHALDFHKLRNEDWIFCTSYENMKMDLRGVIMGVCKFLNKSISEDQMQQMLHHLSFEQMKINPQTNHVNDSSFIREITKAETPEQRFIRKGQIGSYKEELSIELREELDKWIENSLKPFDVTLDELKQLKCCG